MGGLRIRGQALHRSERTRSQCHGFALVHLVCHDQPMSIEEPTAESAPTPGIQGGTSVPPPLPPPPKKKKTGLVIGIVAAAVVVLIIIIVAVVAGGKKDTAPSPSAPSVALRTTAETCESIINLLKAKGDEPTPEQVESMRSEIQRAQQPLKEHIMAVVASYEALALIVTPSSDPSGEAQLAVLKAQLAALEGIKKECESAGFVVR